MPEPNAAYRTQPAARGLAANSRAPDPCTIVLFGATGDLAHRKLVRRSFSSPRGATFPPNAPSSASPAATGPMTTSAPSTRRSLEQERRGRLSASLAPVRQPHLSSRREPLTTRAAYQNLKETLDESTGPRHAGQPGLLPGRRSRVFRDDHRAAGRGGLIYPGHQETPGAGSSSRSRSATTWQCPRLEPRRLRGARREPGLSHRPLPRQGDGPEHPRPPVRQQHLRADLEPPACRLGADHGGRGSRHGRRPGRVL